MVKKYDISAVTLFLKVVYNVFKIEWESIILFKKEVKDICWLETSEALKVGEYQIILNPGWNIIIATFIALIELLAASVMVRLKSVRM
jgi:hypothetical protein